MRNLLIYFSKIQTKNHKNTFTHFQDLIMFFDKKMCIVQKKEDDNDNANSDNEIRDEFDAYKSFCEYSDDSSDHSDDFVDNTGIRNRIKQQMGIEMWQQKQLKKIEKRKKEVMYI